MGEMADWINEQSDDPYLDDHFPDIEEDGNGPASISCKHCGNGPLWWIETSQGWRLANGQKEIHACAEYKPKGAN